MSLVLPLAASDHVAAAYLVFLALVLVYLGIMASKLSRFERDVAELNELLDRRTEETSAPAREELVR